METYFNYPLPVLTSKSANQDSLSPHLRILGHSLSLALDIGALEECLALERGSGGHPQLVQAEGIFAPPAVPYCEFLMLRNGFGKLLAVTRLMRLGGANPIPGVMKSDRFQLSPLLTALRYSRERVMEMGVPAFLPGCDTVKATELLWRGMRHHMEYKGIGFVLGIDVLPHFENCGNPLSSLMEAHGLHPDLELETRSNFRSNNFDLPVTHGHAEYDSSSLRLPPGLNEALRRGCRLAAQPILNRAARQWEFLWVSSREMLISGSGHS